MSSETEVGEGMLSTPEGSFLAQMWKHLAREAQV